MRLSDLKNGQIGVIKKVHGRGTFRKRIIEMGFIKGKTVRVIKNAPLKDPIEYKLMDYNVSLRRSEASSIDVSPMQADNPDHKKYSDETTRIHTDRETPLSRLAKGYRAYGDSGVVFDQDLEFERQPHRRRNRHNSVGFGKARRFQSAKHEIASADNRGKPITVALVGNPNSGKTTIFNHASGSRQRVGNYCGVTIEAKEARIAKNGYLLYITDLPGTYSITEYSPEELCVRETIIESKPDVVVNVIDASNLERNLFLTAQLIEMDLNIVAALNMTDELQKKGDTFDHDSLGKMLGIPFVPTIGTTGEGLEELFAKIIEVYENRDATVRSININYGQDIEKAITSIESVMGGCALPYNVSRRYAAIKLLEKDAHIKDILSTCTASENIILQAKKQILFLEDELKEDCQTLIADARYGFIAGALKETYLPGIRPAVSISEKIDSIVTHQILGLPIFLFFLWLTFQLTFSLGRYPMDWIQAGVTLLARFTSETMQQGLLQELITEGIIPGVGGVIMFLPNILILFFVISLMEDSGYMARAAFIMDRLMHSIGLHGKSFIPLMMGFGCNVPAIMAVRTLESRKDRILTMLIIPFMSCSARLPVYVLLTSAFFPAMAGSILFLLYLTGACLGAVSAMILKKSIFRKSEAPFVMELPPYRVPRLKNTARHMWERTEEYLKKIGGIVLIAAILIWALARFPEQGQVKNLETLKESERLEHSYIGSIGKFIEPALAPLGFDWKMGASILTGLAAKEITVSTMAILYHTDKDSRHESGSLVNEIREQKYTTGPRAGQSIFDPIVALGFLVFILLYFPCAATLVAMKRESGSWKWPLFSALFSTSLAWCASFLIRQIGLLMG